MVRFAAPVQLAVTVCGGVGVALSLDLRRDFFRTEFTSEPFTPFRLFYYPAVLEEASSEAYRCLDTRRAF